MTATDTFRLHWTTPAAWADAVARDPVALLCDHAHCEMKAAASAMALLRKNGDRPGLSRRVAPLVKEEVDHMHRVLRELDARGATLTPDLPSPYARGLAKGAGAGRTSGAEDGYLDALVVSALIEMRSHERFELLAECEALMDLRGFYVSLGEAEERHGELFVTLAVEAFGEERVGVRFGEVAAVEAEVISGLACEPRVHSGVVGL